MVCPRCQAVIPDESKFCRECGEKQFSVCATCGSDVPSGRRVCARCGCPVSPASGTETASLRFPGERRHITVLFSDLSAQSSLSEYLDPEEAKEFMGKLFAEISGIIGRYDGFTEKYVGDAIMAVFGALKTHEDDPIRAIKAAQEIHEKVKDLHREFERIRSPFYMQTGIDTGLAITGEMDIRKGTHGILGGTINMASRLQALAKADEIIVGSETFRHSQGYFHFEQMEPVKVKGRDLFVTPYRVLEAKIDPRKTRSLIGVRSDLVGRAEEIKAIKVAVSDLVAGKGAIISIVGEAGTGKSRVVEEIRSTINRNRIQWYEGHAFSYSQNIPYFPLTDLLSRILQVRREHSSDEIKQLVETGFRRLLKEREDLVPYIGSLFSISYPGIEKSSPEYWKARLREGVKMIVSEISKAAPTVICIEDLHWADPSSVELLGDILSEFRDAVLFICVYRPSFSLGQMDITDGGRELMLSDLSHAEVRMMLESLLQTADIPDALVNLANEKTEGNPFYVEEVLNSLIESSALVREDGKWLMVKNRDNVAIPSTIQGIILARLDRLDGVSKRIIQEASVMGRIFDLDVMKKITMHGDSLEISISNLESLDLVRARLYRQKTDYVFKHALTQEVVYNALLKKERQEIHEKLGQVMEAVYHDRLPDFYEPLAFHFKQSSLLQKAILYLRRAGEKNLKRYALDEAHTYYREAFNLLAGKDDRSREEDILFIDVILDWMVVYYHQGANAMMYEILNRHEALFLSTADKERLGMYYVRIGAAIGRLERMREASDYLQKALSIGEEIVNEPIIGYACSWLILYYADLGRLDDAIVLGKRVQAMRIYHEDGDIFRLTTASIAYAHYFQGNARQAYDGGNMLLEYGREHDNVGCIVHGYTCRAFGHLVRGDYPSAIDSLKEAVAAATEPVYGYTAKIMLGLTYVSNNQFAEAYGILQDITAYHEKHGYGLVGTIAQGLYGIVMITRGNLKEGVETVKRAIELCRQNESRYRYATLNFILARVYLKLRSGGGKRDYSVIWRNLWFLVATLPMARKLAGQHLDEAMKTAEEIGARCILGQVYLEAGQLHRQQGDIGQAEKFTADAVRLLRECDAERLLKQAGEIGRG